MEDKRISIFGKVLVKARKERGVTQAELARRINRDPRTLSMTENGLREPKASTILVYAKALGMRSGDLMNAYEDAFFEAERNNIGGKADEIEI